MSTPVGPTFFQEPASMIRYCSPMSTLNAPAAPMSSMMPGKIESSWRWPAISK
jgi:hypothetical protein